MRKPWCNYDGSHDMFDGPIDENPIGVDGIFC